MGWAPVALTLAAVFVAAVALVLGCTGLTGGSDDGGRDAAAAAGETVAGVLEGEFKASPGGAATYRVPIQVPPGTAGMTPELALVYDSQTGGGLLGKSWRLGGLSAVTRCPRTLATDGVAGGIDFGRGDRFCLDGARLIAIQDAAGRPLATRAERDAAYGRDGTVYHTEVESWTQVTSHGDCGGGPCSFTAVQAEGIRLSYGAAGHSAAPAVGPRFESGELQGAIRQWGLDGVEDLRGNTLAVTYNEPDATGQSLALRIDYSGNAGVGLEPGRSVRFELGFDRADAEPTFVGGARVLNTARLEAVQTYLGETPVLRTELAYDRAPGTGRSRLHTLTLADAAGDRFRPTRFTWQDLDLGLSRAARFSTGTRVEESVEVPLELTGDGLSDFVRLQPSGDQTSLGIWVSEGAAYRNTFTPYATGVPWTGGRHFDADVDGSGRGGLVLVYEKDGGVWGSLWVSDGRKLANEAPPLRFGEAVEDDFVSGDLDDDGRTDVLRPFRDASNRTRIDAWTSNGRTFGLAAPTRSSDLPFDGSHFLALDLDGDNRTSLAVVYQELGQARAAFFSLAGGTLQRGPADVTLGPWEDESTVFAVDVNGDGNQDLMRVYEDDDRQVAWDLFLSDGYTLQTENRGGSTGLPFDGARSLPLDLNGDGRTDWLLLYVKSGELRARAWISDGAELVESDLEIVLGLAADDLAVLPVDTNGDALQEVLHLYRQGTAAQAASWLADGPFPDLVTRIESGTGGWIEVEHRPLSDPAVYTRGTGATYPQADVQGAFYVVARHTSHDGLGDPALPAEENARRGHLYATAYHYAGSRNDLQGRGWLGFREVTATGVYTGKVTVSTMLQDFPFTGSQVSVETLCNAGNPVDPRCTADGTVLGIQRTGYYCQPGAPCDGEAASWFQPYPGVYQLLLQRQEQESWEYGTYQFTLGEEVRSYGDYGAPTAVLQVRDADDPAANLTVCSYYRNDPQRWALGYPTDQLVLAGEAACPAAPAWIDGALGWETRSYDGDLEVRTEGEWDDSRSGGGAFLTRYYAYDPVGNRTRESIPYYPASDLDPAAVPAQETVYDDLYRTFPVRELSPPDEAGDRLVSTFEYDPRFGVETRATDPNGNRTVTLVDGFGRSVEARVTSPRDGSLVTVERTRWQEEGAFLAVLAEQRMDWETELWNFQRNVQDGLGRSVRVESAAADPARTVVETLGYDALGQTSRESLPYFDGATPAGSVDTTYDLYEREVRVVDPDGTVTELTYGGSAGGTEVTNLAAAGTAEPRRIRDRFNRLGDLVERRFYPRQEDGSWGDPVTLSFDYDPLQRLVRVEDAGGVVDRVDYDSLGRQRWVEVDGPDGYDLGRTTFAYGDHGALREVASPAASDAGGEQRQVFEYDHLGRTRTRALLPGGPTYTLVYDQPSQWLPDAVNTRGQLTGVSASDGSVAYGFSYDTRDNPTRQTLLLGHDQPTRELPVRELNVSYDPQARQQGLVFPDGTEQWNRYHRDGSLAAIDLRLPGRDAATPFVTYGDYDALREPGTVRYRDREGAETAVGTYRYVPTTGLADRVSLRRTAGDGATLLDNALAWSPLGQLETLVDCNHAGSAGLPGCDGAAGDHPVDYGQSFEHDALGRLTRARGLYGDLAYRYGGAGNLLHKGGVTYEYEGHQVRSGSDGYAADYFPDGTLKRRTSVHGGAGAVTWSYAWDAADRLTAAQRDGVPAEEGTVTFAYDHTDARISKTGADGAVTLYYGEVFEVRLDPDGTLEESRIVLGPTGRVMTLRSTTSAASSVAAMGGAGGGDSGGTGGEDRGAAAGGGAAPPGSPSGAPPAAPPNAPPEPAWLLLLLAALPALLAPLGRRWAALRRWLRRGDLAALLAVLLSRRSGAPRCPRWVRCLAVPVALAVLFTVCLPPPVVEAAERPPAAQEAAQAAADAALTLAYFHHDPVGSVTLAFGEQGQLLSHLVYRPFGELDREHSIDPDLVEARFDDQVWDPETGLYFFNARYYDPAVGRFVSADSLAALDGPFASDYDRYAFSNNDPVDYADPSGHLAFLVAIAIGAVVGAVVSGAVYGIQTAVSGEEFSWAEFGIAVGAGALGGAIGGAFGGSLLVGGIVGGAVSAGAEQVVTNLAHGESWSNNLGQAVLLGAVVGGITAGVGKGIGRAATRVRGKWGKGAPFSRGRVNACASFPEGTTVYAFGGPRDVTEVLGGESVWAVGEEVGAAVASGPLTPLEPEAALVSVAVERNADEMVTVEVAGEAVRATPEHPFLVEGRGWVLAGELRAGDPLVDGFGESFPVTRVSRERGLFRVFNFTVDGAHTYLVGDSAFLVHNAKCKLKKGGAYGHQQVNPGEEIDHIPAKANYRGIPTIRGSKISAHRGPSVRMKRSHHLLTTSWGSSKQARKLRARHRAWIQAGRFDLALEEDVRERVVKFAGQYNAGLTAAVRYSYDAGYITAAQRNRILKVIK